MDDPYLTDEMRSMRETADFFGIKVSKKELYEATKIKFAV